MKSSSLNSDGGLSRARESSSASRGVEATGDEGADIIVDVNYCLAL